MHLRNVTLATLALATVAFCQSPATLDTVYQVRYAANLNVGESYVDIINTGFNGVALNGPGITNNNAAPTGFGNTGIGNICVNLYALATDEQLDACCSCLVTPDEVVSLGVNSSLLVKTLTGATATSETIKIIGTTVVGNSCSNSAGQIGTNGFTLLNGGYVAFGTTLHAAPTTPVTYATTETAFLPAQFDRTGALAPNDEISSLRNRCANILGNGSGFGICGGCKQGALGASKQ